MGVRLTPVAPTWDDHQRARQPVSAGPLVRCAQLGRGVAAGGAARPTLDDV